MIDIAYFYAACTLVSVGVSIFNKAFGGIVFFVGGVLTLIDFFSMQMLNTHINLLALLGFDFSMLKMAPKVVPASFFGGLVFLGVHLLLPVIVYKHFKQKRFSKFYCLTALLLVLSAGYFYSQSQTVIAYKQMATHMYNLHKYEKFSAHDLFNKLSSKENYLLMHQVQAKAGKNLVVIYCESLESNFLNTKYFPLETRKLNQLKNKGWSFYSNYQSVYGSGWTIAALYSTQTSLPCLFGASKARLGGNSALTNLRSNEAVSYTGVLSKAGYKNVFMSNSSLKFSGTGNLMSLFGYECKGWDKFGKNAKRTKWGVHDYDLFQAAKAEFKKLSGEGTPFNLTLLTIDTHFPKGLSDTRLRTKIDKRIPTNSHEYTLASLDYLLDDFIQFVYKNSNGKEPIVVILGDHLMAGNETITPIVTKLKHSPRKVLLMTNKPLPNYNNGDSIAFYDIPKAILNLLEVETNARFLKDIIPDVSPKFIIKNQDIFTIINMKICK